MLLDKFQHTRELRLASARCEAHKKLKLFLKGVDLFSFAVLFSKKTLIYI